MKPVNGRKSLWAMGQRGHTSLLTLRWRKVRAIVDTGEGGRDCVLLLILEMDKGVTNQVIKAAEEAAEGMEIILPLSLRSGHGPAE